MATRRKLLLSRLDHNKRSFSIQSFIKNERELYEKCTTKGIGTP